MNVQLLFRNSMEKEYCNNFDSKRGEGEMKEREREGQAHQKQPIEFFMDCFGWSHVGTAVEHAMFLKMIATLNDEIRDTLLFGSR